MAYMPAMPGMPGMSAGPAPVSPSIKVPSVTGAGKPSGIAAIAHSVGKPGNTQHLGSIVGKRGGGMNGISGGNLAAHAGGSYGKMAGDTKPAVQHGGLGMIKGGSGGIRRNVRAGGLGPGKMSTPGPSNQNYSQQPEDSE